VASQLLTGRRRIPEGIAHVAGCFRRPTLPAVGDRPAGLDAARAAIDEGLFEDGRACVRAKARSELATPPLATALVEEGIGRSYGGQVLLREELTHGLFGWITYSVIRSQRKDHPDTDWRLLDYDQTHVASVLARYDLGHGWQLGGRFRYATGVPRTPVMGSYFDARDDQYEPLFGGENAIRVPAFYQLDARLERTFTVADHRTNVFLDVQNLTTARIRSRSSTTSIIRCRDTSPACRRSPSSV
jgi:hypothetical protein